MVKSSSWGPRFGLKFLTGYGLILAISWLGGAFFFQEIDVLGHWKLMVAWSIVSAGTTLLILDLMGFFDLIRYVPQKRNMITLGLAAPLGAVIAKYLLFSVRGIPVARYREIIWVAPLVAIIAYGYHYATWLSINRSKFKMRILAAITEREQARLERAIRECGLPDFAIFRRLDGKELALSKDEPIDWIIYSRVTLRDLVKDLIIVKKIVLGSPAIEWRRFLIHLRRRVDLDLFDTWTFIQYLDEGGFTSRFYGFMKVILEPVAALLIMAAFSPFFLLICCLIRIDSKGAPIFSQMRTGDGERNFKLYKFRTMVEDAEEGGPSWSAHGDSRITRFGTFLRKTRLDEMPQLWNVFKREMSFIGPRPERPEYYAKFETSIPLFSMRTAVKPGITGWAQVHHGYAASVEESIIKLEYDLYYLLNQSLWMDMAIVFKTFSLFYRGGGTGR